MKKFVIAALSGSLAGIIATTQVAGPLLAQEAARNSNVYEQLDLFGDIFERIRVQYVEEVDEAELIERQRREAAEREKMAFEHAAASGMAGEGGEAQAQPEAPETPATFTREQPKVGRNEPCPCGSGKKYKQCCGKL